MLTVVRDSCSTWKPALRRRPTAFLIVASSDAKFAADSAVTAPASNSDTPPSERGDACAYTTCGSPLEVFRGAVFAAVALRRTVAARGVRRRARRRGASAIGASSVDGTDYRGRAGRGRTGRTHADPRRGH